MSSIRPLITITILVAVAVFLFMKINEVPVALPPDSGEMAGLAAPADIPPLSTADSPSAPAWNGSTSGASESVATAPVVPPVTLPAEIPSAIVAQEAPAVPPPADLPPIPELPPIAATVEPNAAPLTPAAETSPIPLPANIPLAQYPGESTNTNSVAPAEAITPPVPSAYQTVAAPSTAETTPGAALAPPPESEDRYGMPSVDNTATTPATTITPSPTSETVTSAAPITPIAPATPTLASDWPQIQGALERQELVKAHELLSRWYGNPNLTPAEAQQVEQLLGQLAGTVVYSTEHRLEPPYTVHAGDTLQTIAQQYDVPWQLLAKINGIPAANMVQPGQQLKVVHGPFSAVVELDKSQMTLMLDGRYAGRFPITVPSGANVNEGQWVLEQKLVQPATQESGVVSASYTAAAVEHVLVLRNESPTAGGTTISITAGPGAPSGPTAVAPSAIRLSPRDVEEVADILSVGSPVTIRR